MASNHQPSGSRTTRIAAVPTTPAEPSPVELMTTPEICEMLKISRDTLYEWREVNAGPPAFKLPNGQLRFPLDEFKCWLESRRGMAA